MYLRDQRKPWELPDSKLKALIDKLEAITETKFNEAFADNVNNFIGILRETHLIEKHAKTNKEVKRQLTQLRNALQKVATLDDSVLGDHAGMMLMSSMPGGMEEYVNASNAIETLLTACKTAISKVNERTRAKEFKFLQVQQSMATELARELAGFGVNITAYRDGIFAQCVREFLQAYNGNVGDQKFRMYVPEDLFTVIQKAKDGYTNPERFLLLNLR